MIRIYARKQVSFICNNCSVLFFHFGGCLTSTHVGFRIPRSTKGSRIRVGMERPLFPVWHLFVFSVIMFMLVMLLFMVSIFVFMMAFTRRMIMLMMTMM